MSNEENLRTIEEKLMWEKRAIWAENPEGCLIIESNQPSQEATYKIQAEQQDEREYKEKI